MKTDSDQDPAERDMRLADPTPFAFEETLAAARAGDLEAREALVRRVYPRVEHMVHQALARDLRLSRPWLPARFSTGDIVQDVFRSLIQDLTGFSGTNEAAFVGYLAMIVRNRLLDAIRFHEAAQRDGRRTAQVPEDEEIEGPPELDLLPSDELEQFLAALRTFPEREQLLLRARIEEGVEFQELADRLGYSSRFAARRAFYAAQALLLIRMRTRPAPRPTEPPQ
jgi:RNA polymerase sigma factor (sigma-70 family)